MYCIKASVCRTIQIAIQQSAGHKNIVCASYNNWVSRRSLSQYVQKIRHLQELKENGDVCAKSLDDAQFAVFYGLRPFVREVQSEYGIAWMSKSGR